MMGVRGEPSKTGAQSALLFVPLYSTSFRCGTKGFVCHAKKYGVHSTILLVRLPPLKLWQDKQLRKPLAARGILFTGIVHQTLFQH